MDHKGKAWKAENGVRKTTKENFPKTNKFQKWHSHVVNYIQMRPQNYKDFASFF